MRQTEEVHPRCPKCWTQMRLIQSLNGFDVFPEVQGFKCDKCGESLIREN
jgi:ssDNA-binding Zn-finger/Zn-ribbon topoisomerase 1